MTARDQVLDLEIAFEPDEDSFHVWRPVLKGCHSFGVSKEEARANIPEAIEGWLESAEELGFPIPDREHITVAAH